MVTALTPGYIYFLESDAVDNQNWIAGGASSINLDSFTEGTEYCKLAIPESYQIEFNTGIVVEQGGAASSYDTRSERRWYKALASGIETTRANAAVVRNYFMLERHTSGTAATFKRYHMVIIYSSGTYEPFINATGSSVNYCTGAVLNGRTIWQHSEDLMAKIHINWRSVW